jgi:hypothetical protein
MTILVAKWSHKETAITFKHFLRRIGQFKNSATHTQLNNDLVEHHWQLYGGKMMNSFIYLYSYLFMCAMNIYLPSEHLILCVVIWIETITIIFFEGLWQ